MSPAPAGASSVTVEQRDSCLDIYCTKYDSGYPVAVTVVAGDPGEANRITVMRTGDSWQFRDDGAPLRGCTPCPVTPGAPGIAGLSVNLGDGDDTLVLASGAATFIDGGDGNDTVTAGGEDDEIDGGAGADHLTGGGGEDTLSFATRTTPLRIDVASGTSSEGDVFAGFGTVVGGHGADVIRGSSGPDVLHGKSGDDRLYGRGGNDTLRGGRGTDRLYGGTGHDALYGDPFQGDGFDYPYFRMGDDRLYGGPGGDFLDDYGGGHNVYRGGPGADVLWLGTGPDRAFGGTGADRIDAKGNGRDRVDCGPGRDRITADRRDIQRNCHP